MANRFQTSYATEALHEFHGALNDEPGRGNAPLRVTLHQEEHDELIEALELGDRAKIARELADVLYIAYGTAHSFDIDLDAAFAEIHRAAMSKLVGPGLPITREDGKILKPPGFVPPDMTCAVTKCEHVTHGRHCVCSSCAREDWTNPALASCGMHGASCPAEYAPRGLAGSMVPAKSRPDDCPGCHGRRWVQDDEGGPRFDCSLCVTSSREQYGPSYNDGEEFGR